MLPNPAADFNRYGKLKWHKTCSGLLIQGLNSLATGHTFPNPRMDEVTMLNDYNFHLMNHYSIFGYNSSYDPMFSTLGIGNWQFRFVEKKVDGPDFPPEVKRYVKQWDWCYENGYPIEIVYGNNACSPLPFEYFNWFDVWWNWKMGRKPFKLTKEEQENADRDYKLAKLRQAFQYYMLTDQTFRNAYYEAIHNQQKNELLRFLTDQSEKWTAATLSCVKEEMSKSDPGVKINEKELEKSVMAYWKKIEQPKPNERIAIIKYDENGVQLRNRNQKFHSFKIVISNRKTLEAREKSHEFIVPIDDSEDYSRLLAALMMDQMPNNEAYQVAQHMFHSGTAEAPPNLFSGHLQMPAPYPMPGQFGQHFPAS